MLAARGIGTVIQARAATSSMEYSYSFDPELEQEWVWPDKYSKQSDILRYANHVAERYDLLKDIQFETRIKSAFYDRDANTWTIETTEGQKVRAQYCIMAVGNLSTPRVPDFKGVDSFKGDWYHSGLWPKEEVDFSGKRVGIIGTGSTAIQIIPHVAQQAKHLTIFQRTANYSLPARNGPLPEDVRAAHKEEVPGVTRTSLFHTVRYRRVSAAKERGHRGHSGGTRCQISREMGGRRDDQLPLLVYRPPAERRIEQDRIGFRPRAYSRYRQRPGDGGVALPERSSDRHETDLFG